jgi:hypothetical protein
MTSRPMMRARRPIATFAAVVRGASLATCAVASTVFGAASCDQTPLPGNQLGTYAVTGSLTSNSCGAGVMAPASLSFNATISESEAGTTLYWSSDFGTGSTPTTLSGSLVNSSASLTTTPVVANVDGTNGVTGPCNLDEGVVLDIDLGSGSPPNTFTGTVSFSDTVDPSSATAENPCNDQLTQNGGTLDTLPCAFAYSLSGSLQ